MVVLCKMVENFVISGMDIFMFFQDIKKMDLDGNIRKVHLNVRPKWLNSLEVQCINKAG